MEGCRSTQGRRGKIFASVKCEPRKLSRGLVWGSPHSCNSVRITLKKAHYRELTGRSGHTRPRPLPVPCKTIEQCNRRGDPASPGRHQACPGRHLNGLHLHTMLSNFQHRQPSYHPLLAQDRPGLTIRVGWHSVIRKFMPASAAPRLARELHG